MATIAAPVFPLKAVLFPGTALPLHIFEPRYRQMLIDVRAEDGVFALLPNLPGVPERDLPPGRCACLAAITEVEALDDGRSNIMIRGHERVALTRFLEHDAPYHVAEFTTVADEPGDLAVALAVAADELAANFRRVVKAVHVLNDTTTPPPPLPDEASQLAWTIASMIDLDVTQRYALLADRSPASRIATVDALLRRVLPDLELQAALRAEALRS